MARTEERITALIEIPMGSRNKYEYDPGSGKIRLDRVLYASVVYPAQYGFIPETKAPDGDPLDVLVLATEPVFPGCLVDARLLGALRMRDQGEDDYKLLAVTDCDPRYAEIAKLSDVSGHTLTEIEHFFRVYKDLEGKKVEVAGWEDRATALRLIAQARQAYREAR